MTRATELALKLNQESNSVLDVDNNDRTLLHSGEVNFGVGEGHSGERIIPQKQVLFSSKTKQLVPIKPVRIDALKYDNANIVSFIIKYIVIGFRIQFHFFSV